MPVIKSLWIYPVKSLRGFSVNSALLSPQGLQYDRHWMVINEQNQYVTQRKLSQMILIHTHIHNGQLILSKPSEPSLGSCSIACQTLPKNQKPQRQDQKITATIWKDSCQVIDEGTEVSTWLTRAIGSKNTLRLVRMAEEKRPQSKPELLFPISVFPELKEIETHTLFADAAPFLVTNQASLERVNQQMINAGHSPVTMENFRPNIIIHHLPAFAEHQIQYLTHSNYQLRHCYPCKRCVIPTINIDSGQRHPKQQPFSLIAQINAMPNQLKAPAFGENAILTQGIGSTITVGDMLKHK